MDLTLLVFRIVMGGLFVGHGSQKLFGAFGGQGLGGTAATFEKIGLPPGRRNAVAAGLAEALGGLLIALGLIVPLGAAALIATMVAAVVAVHARNGVWVTENGFEYNLVLIAAAFLLTGVGPGAWSLDAVLGLGLSGAGWALGALGAGLLGGIGAVVDGRLHREREERDVHRPHHPHPA
jgi:putative oxidoreductase